MYKIDVNNSNIYYIGHLLSSFIYLSNQEQEFYRRLHHKIIYHILVFFFFFFFRVQNSHIFIFSIYNTVYVGISLIEKIIFYFGKSTIEKFKRTDLFTERNEKKKRNYGQITRSLIHNTASQSVIDSYSYVFFCFLF